jgi:hypothetical protein
MERVVGRTSVSRNPPPYLLVGAARGVRSRCGREKWCAQTRRALRMKMFIAAACFGTLAVTALGMAGETAAAPSGFANFGNAQDTVNALQARGYNVQVNGATVYPMSSCKVLGVEGLNNSNINSAGARIDPTQFDTVYVDVSCRGG